MRGVLVALALVAVALLQAWFDPNAGIRSWLQLRQDVARAEGGAARLQAEIAALDGELEALRLDPRAQERAIREELDLVRPGEILVRMPTGGKPTDPLP